MKKILTLLLFGLTLIGHASQEWHTFTSVDGERTFTGQLTGYDAASKTVSVVNSQRQHISFNLDVISESDRDFVIANAKDLTAANANIQMRFEQIRERKAAERGNNTRRTTYDGGYTISVNSFTPQDIVGAQVEYLMIYRKDQVTGQGTNEVVRGSKTVNIPANASVPVQTDIVELVNFYQAGKVSKGGCGGGSCGKTTATRAQRSRDYLIGCIARVSVNGKVVSVSATAPNVLRQYESEFGDHYESYTSR